MVEAFFGPDAGLVEDEETAGLAFLVDQTWLDVGRLADDLLSYTRGPSGILKEWRLESSILCRSLMLTLNAFSRPNVRGTRICSSSRCGSRSMRRTMLVMWVRKAGL